MRYLLTGRGNTAQNTNNFTTVRTSNHNIVHFHNYGNESYEERVVPFLWYGSGWVIRSVLTAECLNRDKRRENTSTFVTLTKPKFLFLCKCRLEAFGSFQYVLYMYTGMFTSEVLSLSLTCGRIHTLLSTRVPLGYKWGQFVETPLQFTEEMLITYF